MKERARPAVLGEDLTETVLARNVEVLRPIEAAPELNCTDDELRAVQRSLERSRRTDLGGAAELFDERFGVAANVQEIVGEDIHETQLDVALRERLAEQHIAHGFRPERAAAGTD